MEKIKLGGEWEGNLLESVYLTELGYIMFKIFDPKRGIYTNVNVGTVESVSNNKILIYKK
jgi:hypothetical protein